MKLYFLVFYFNIFLIINNFHSDQLNADKWNEKHNLLRDLPVHQQDQINRALSRKIISI